MQRCNRQLFRGAEDIPCLGRTQNFQARSDLAATSRLPGLAMAEFQPGPASPDRSAGPADALLRRCLALLPRGEPLVLRGVLDEVDALPDAERRMWVALELIDRALARTATLEVAAGIELDRTLASWALQLLECQPCEPELLWRAGALLQALHADAAAGALLSAARRLDPTLEPAQSAEQVAPGQSPVGVVPPQFPVGVVPPQSSAGVVLPQSSVRAGAPEALPAADARLSRQALALAERAQPATGLRLSLCMIVRDEQEALPRCLRSVADAVDELVVVDTGSSDDTVQIARSFGAHVISSPWEGSFAHARNVSFDAASGDWILFLDADEVLLEGAQQLRSLTAQSWCEAFYVSIVSHTGSLSDGTSVTHRALRLLRNRPQYRFEGRLHEQIAVRLPGFLPGRLRESAVRIEHFGYLHDVRARRQKSARNIGLLRLQQAEGRPSSFLHFNIGCEHAAGEDHEAALSEFERAWALLSRRRDPAGSEFAPALIKRLAGTLRACGRNAEAIARAGEGLKLFPDFTDLVFEQALACAAQDRPEAAIELFERCLQMGEPPTHYPSSAGCGSYRAQLQLAELRRARGESALAIALLQACLHGQQRHPGSGAARVALAELLLAERRYREAAEVLEDTPVQDVHALPAARTQLFALIADGEPSGVQGALERAQASGMSASEIELFGGWQQLTSSGHSKIAPSPAAVPRLLAMLETLLAAQDFDGFELLLTLLARAALPERERREALADMYLRRGFLASAAEEWMLVCRSGSDARALLGLARVAVAQGMPREASDFAAAALEKDSANEAAAALLRQLQPVSM